MQSSSPQFRQYQYTNQVYYVNPALKRERMNTFDLKEDTKLPSIQYQDTTRLSSQFVKSKGKGLQSQLNGNQEPIGKEQTLNLETSILSKVTNINQSIRMNQKTYNGLYDDYQCFKKDVNKLKSKRFTNILKPLRDKPSVNIEKEMSIFEKLKQEDKFGLQKLQRNIKVADVMFNLKYDVYCKNDALTSVINHYNDKKDEQIYFKDLKSMFLRKKKLKLLQEENKES